MHHVAAHLRDLFRDQVERRAKPLMRSFLVFAGEPAVAGDVGAEDRREFPGEPPSAMAFPLSRQTDRWGTGDALAGAGRVSSTRRLTRLR